MGFVDFPDFCFSESKDGIAKHAYDYNEGGNRLLHEFSPVLIPVLGLTSNLQNTDYLYQSSFSTIQVSGFGCQASGRY
jgi:hypothetical protein